jgi:hypothetical protein
MFQEMKKSPHIYFCPCWNTISMLLLDGEVQRPFNISRFILPSPQNCRLWIRIEKNVPLLLSLMLHLKLLNGSLWTCVTVRFPWRKKEKNTHPCVCCFLFFFLSSSFSSLCLRHNNEEKRRRKKINKKSVPRRENRVRVRVRNFFFLPYKEKTRWVLTWANIFLSFFLLGVRTCVYLFYKFCELEHSVWYY